MWLSPDEYSDLDTCRFRTGLTAAALFRRFLREMAHARKLETQGRRKVELDSAEDLPHIERLIVIARGRAEADGAIFRDTRDPIRRTIYHEDLRTSTGDVAWLEDLASKLRDAQVRMEDPAYRPRHRYVGETPSHPAASASSAQGLPESAT